MDLYDDLDPVLARKLREVDSLIESLKNAVAAEERARNLAHVMTVVSVIALIAYAVGFVLWMFS